MTDRDQERIAALEAYERERNDEARRAREVGSGELDEGTRELASLLGLPDTRDGLEAHFRRESLRRRLRIFGLAVGAFLLLAAAWLLFRLLT